MLRFFAFVAAGFVSLIAQAANYVPLLSKTTHSGYVAPGYRTYSRCEIYADKVVITYMAEGVKSVQERVIDLSGAYTAIDEAAKGPIIEKAGPVDGPALVYSARRVLVTNELDTVDLGSDQGSGTITINNSVAARGLRNFIDMNCK